MLIVLGPGVFLIRYHHGGIDIERSWWGVAKLFWRYVRIWRRPVTIASMDVTANTPDENALVLDALKTYFDLARPEPEKLAIERALAAANLRNRPHP